MCILLLAMWNWYYDPLSLGAPLLKSLMASPYGSPSILTASHHCSFCHYRVALGVLNERRL